MDAERTSFLFIIAKGSVKYLHRVSHCTYFSNSLSLFTERIKIGKPETVGHKQKNNYWKRTSNTEIFDRCCYTSAVGSLKTILTQRLFEEKGDIKVNNDANSGNINHCLFTAHHHGLYLGCGFCPLRLFRGKHDQQRRGLQMHKIVSSSTVSCITFHTGTVKA